jgi:hypothetical protein
VRRCVKQARLRDLDEVGRRVRSSALNAARRGGRDGEHGCANPYTNQVLKDAWRSAYDAAFAERTRAKVDARSVRAEGDGPWRKSS